MWGEIILLFSKYCRLVKKLFSNRSIHYDLKESDIVTLFSTFGPVVRSEMTLDPVTQRSKGFCFVEYDDPAFAQAAMAMDGFELAGRKIKVGWPTHGQGSMSTQQPGLPLLPGANPLLQVGILL